MKKKNLPIFGIGPVYVILILIVTIISIFMSILGYIPLVKLDSILIKFLGIMFIFLGIYLWMNAVFVSKIDQNIKKNKLVTWGVYAYVRNPIYSAFLLFFTGIILYFSNLLLFILPFGYWYFLTVLLRCTEEKWLYDAFGEEYKQYCKGVNRCIPWFKKQI